MKTETLFSSATDLWETPEYFFRALDSEFHFDLDACATKENAKCKRFFSPEEDGLAQEWTGTVWCNPPYGRQIWKWLKKAYESDATVVCLIHARTDTAWFHEWVLGKAEIRFIRGRLKFGDSKQNAPFPSLLAIYRRKE